MTLFVSIANFIFGLSMCFPGGPLLLNFLDVVIGNWALIVICALEIVVIGWVYGMKKILKDYEQMGIRHSLCFRLYLVLCLQILAPLTILIVFIWSYATRDENKEEPKPITAVKWMLLGFVNVWLPLGLIFWSWKFIARGAFPKWNELIDSTEEWNPICIKAPRLESVE